MEDEEAETRQMSKRNDTKKLENTKLSIASKVMRRSVTLPCPTLGGGGGGGGMVGSTADMDCWAGLSRSSELELKRARVTKHNSG